VSATKARARVRSLAPMARPQAQRVRASAGSASSLLAMTDPTSERAVLGGRHLWLPGRLLRFGGPPAQIALLRQLMVDRMRWMEAREFQDADAVCGLLPGPAAIGAILGAAILLAGVILALAGAPLP
jgi:hypothetical protein